MLKKISFLLACLVGLVLVSYKTVDKHYKEASLKFKKASLDTLLINDGPCVFITNYSLVEKRIVNNQLVSKTLH